MSDRPIFAPLPMARRVWAVASVHGEAERLRRLHDLLWPRLEPGDRLVYLGNLLGRGGAVVEALDEVLLFRRAVMAIEPAEASHVALLRGGQEEMWQKLLQLQFATDPKAVLAWMLDNGVGATLQAYGGSLEEARRQAATGVVGITRWTQQLRAAIQAHAGHFEVFGALRRAAFTDDGKLLFVNAGLDPSRPLEAQRDSFWWGGAGFSALDRPFGGYRRIVRGFDRSHPGIVEGAFTLTLDGGCGFGGPLLAACLSPEGDLLETLEA
jgi:serine/threonine protein phosphatase 1